MFIVSFSFVLSYVEDKKRIKEVIKPLLGVLGKKTK